MNNNILNEIDAVAEKRKNEIFHSADNLNITGTIYYVSNSGDDSNDGKTPQTPWRTLERVSNTWLMSGDGVLFKRGDVFRGTVIAKEGVTYGAYGEGSKPEFRGWHENLADSSRWVRAFDGYNIWKYTSDVSDPGTLVFNEGEYHSRKLIPSYMNLKFVCRDDESRDFDMRNEMSENLDMFWRFDKILTRDPSKGEDFPVPLTDSNSLGELYLRCDDGNPGEIFESIESIARDAAFRVYSNSNVKIDNISMKYYCFGVSAYEFVRGLHVTNCVIGWIGGNIQHYFGTDPNYPQGKRGTVTRYGNGIEIYGGCDDYLIDNCYIYQSYDAGATHQITTNKKIEMSNIRYTNNLIEKCVYGIEYFLDQIDGESESVMDGVEMSGNIIRLSGYGWGQQRHNTDTPALIKGWSYINTARNYKICNNIFDRSAYRMLHLVAEKDEYCPEMCANTYVQNLGGMIGQYGGNENDEPVIEIFDADAENKIKNVFGDDDAKVYIIR